MCEKIVDLSTWQAFNWIQWDSTMKTLKNIEYSIDSIEDVFFSADGGHTDGACEVYSKHTNQITSVHCHIQLVSTGFNYEKHPTYSRFN